jgi:hypothetical protein
MRHKQEKYPTPVYLLSTPERFEIMFWGVKPAPTVEPVATVSIEDAALLARIKTLSNPPYRTTNPVEYLSATHRNALEELKFEANRRGLKF